MTGKHIGAALAVMALLGAVPQLSVSTAHAQTEQAAANARIAAMRAIINANRNDPVALRKALAEYVANNPAAAPFVSNAIAGQGLPAVALAAIGNAMADARAALATAGNASGAAAVAQEAATLPPAAQSAYQATIRSGTTQTVVINSGATPGAGQPEGNAGLPPLPELPPLRTQTQNSAS